jgi:hypothetical protein
MSTLERNNAMPRPQAPYNLTATAGSSTVDVEWSGWSGVTYRVYRGDNDAGSGFSMIADGLTTTSYTDSPPSMGVNYYYATSVNGFGESSPSNIGGPA